MPKNSIRTFKIILIFKTLSQWVQFNTNGSRNNTVRGLEVKISHHIPFNILNRYGEYTFYPNTPNFTPKPLLSFWTVVQIENLRVFLDETFRLIVHSNYMNIP